MKTTNKNNLYSRVCSALSCIIAPLRTPENAESMLVYAEQAANEYKHDQTWIKLRSACSTDRTCSHAFLMTSSCLSSKGTAVAFHTLAVADS